jgi:murein DD-endopeptidase MepM/ murein hydrolase activator NlpD
LAFRRWHVWTFASLAPVVALLYLGATAYLVLRDDMLASLMRRQNEMQFAYEDRLAAMRVQIDRITSRKLIDQDSVEDKMQSIVARQAQLESRSSMLAMLAANAGVLRDAVASIPAATAHGDHASKATGKIKSPLPASAAGSALGFAPALDMPDSPFATEGGGDSKPRPEGLEIGTDSRLETPPPLRSSRIESDRFDVASDSHMPLRLRLGSIGTAIDRLSLEQMRTVASIGGAAKAAENRLRTALASAGLPADKLVVPPRANTADVGGPFIPMKLDPKASPFEAHVARLQDELLAADTLQRVLPYLPLRRPLPEIVRTSGFGPRIDPFVGRMAMHTGLDLRGRYGAPVRATASGRIDFAGYNGGYGNMVDIDHGNGLVTRYGHMSSIAVKEGESVRAGDVIGYVGSTGRSTGPHLHYEVRLDDTPVNPNKFLRAGAQIFGETSAMQDGPGGRG